MKKEKNTNFRGIERDIEEENDIKYCVNFIINKLKKALKYKKHILEEINNNKKATYFIKIGKIKGKIIIEEEK